MPRFPKKEADVVAQADAVIVGYTANPTVFPNADLAGLQAVRSSYQTGKDDQLDAQAKAQLATETKDGLLDSLETKMQTELKQSEVDTASGAEKLTLIDWGPKASPTASSAPGQPRAFSKYVNISKFQEFNLPVFLYSCILN